MSRELYFHSCGSSLDTASSIVCAKVPHGFVNGRPFEVLYQDRVMIRSRRKTHLEALKSRFPELSSIHRSDERDYRYRVTVTKELWASVVAELAREQTWSNFKSEVHGFQGAKGADYANVLHQVWSLMKKFQESAPADDTDNHTDSPDDEPTGNWDGVTLAETVKEDHARQDLANLAKDYNWRGVLDILADRPDLINATRPGGHSLYAPLHQAAHGGAEIEVVKRLISLGAWRTLRNAKGERPLEIAQKKGYAHLLFILEPVYKRRVPDGILVRIRVGFII